MIYLFIAVYAAVVLVTLFSDKFRFISYVNITAMLVISSIIGTITVFVYKYKTLNLYNDFIYIDSLSVINLLIISIIGLIAVIYSHKYLEAELEEGAVKIGSVKLFYSLFSLFVISMIFVCIFNNVVAMWLGLEATTLSTAFLIGFNRSKLSLEAAWKYVIICSIGIGLGLIGIILSIYSLNVPITEEILNWTYLIANPQHMDPNAAKLAFVFIFIGIGTKAGLAPMHTWLPDGHSEAPSPISAMMSGVLLNIAMYVVIRFYAVIKLVEGLAKFRYMFIIFGCLSLLIASLSILKQNNYKRLLAFSSVENIGIIALGIGFGGVMGTFGALLHTVIHAFGKTLLFLISGNILAAYKTKRIDKIQYMIKSMPVNSVFLILGILIITGAPPFASFFSELYILQEGIMQGQYLAVCVYAVCLLIAFAAFFNIFINMIFTGDNTLEYTKLANDRTNFLPVILTFAFAIGTSLYFGGYLTVIIQRAASILNI